MGVMGMFSETDGIFKAVLGLGMPMELKIAFSFCRRGLSYGYGIVI